MDNRKKIFWITLSTLVGLTVVFAVFYFQLTEKSLDRILTTNSSLTKERQKKLLTPGKDFKIDISEMERVFNEKQDEIYGMHGYPDLPISVLDQDGKWYVWFPAKANDSEKNLKGWSYRFTGPDLSKLKPDPAAENGKAMPVLVNGKPGSIDNAYAGISSVYYDAVSRKMYAWYHAEDYEFPAEIIKKANRVTYGVKENPYYTTIALAVSNDLGKTFEKIGPVLTAGMNKQDIEASVLADPDNYSSVDMCNAAVVHKGQFLYMYYCDISARGKIGLAVARLPVKDINVNPQPWKKFANGIFSSDQFGGDFDVLFDGIFPSVSYNKYLDQFVVVYVREEQDILMRTSADGLNWSEPEVLVHSQSPAWNVYPKLLDGSREDKNHGKELWLYYGHTDDITREGQKLVRRKIILQ